MIKTICYSGQWTNTKDIPIYSHHCTSIY